MNRVIGVAVLAIGVVLLYLGYQSSISPVDQALTAATGSYTNTTIIYVVSGVAAVIGGATVTVFGHRGA